MSGFLRFILYVFIAYILYLILRFLFSPKRRPQAGHTSRKPSGIMVKDEICNTYLPQEDALQEKLDGKDYFFCSEACRKKFLAQRKNRRSDAPD